MANPDLFSGAIRRQAAMDNASKADSNDLLTGSQSTLLQEASINAAQLADSAAFNSAQNGMLLVIQAAQLAEMRSANELLTQLGNVVRRSAEAKPAHEMAAQTSTRQTWINSAGTFAHTNADSAAASNTTKLGMSNG